MPFRSSAAGSPRPPKTWFPASRFGLILPFRKSEIRRIWPRLPANVPLSRWQFVHAGSGDRGSAVRTSLLLNDDQLLRLKMLKTSNRKSKVRFSHLEMLNDL